MALSVLERLNKLDSEHHDPVDSGTALVQQPLVLDESSSATPPPAVGTKAAVGTRETKVALETKDPREMKAAGDIKAAGDDPAAGRKAHRPTGVRVGDRC